MHYKRCILHYIKIYLLYIGIVLEILPNRNGVKTLKVRNLGAVKKIKTYVAPISPNPNFHMIFSLPKIRHMRVYTVIKNTLKRIAFKKRV